MDDIATNKQVSMSFDTSLSAQDNDLWEYELDLLGADASVDVLQAHLDKAPNPYSANAQFLMGFLASHAQPR